MHERLTARGNSKHNTSLFRTRMIEYNQDASRHASSIDATLIDTTRPIETCIQDILGAI